MYVTSLNKRVPLKPGFWDQGGVVEICVAAKLGLRSWAASHNCIRAVKFNGLQHALNVEKNTTVRIQAEITPRADMLVKFHTVFFVHPHELCTTLSDTLFERSPVRFSDVNIVRSAEIHSRFCIPKMSEHATGAIYNQPGSVLACL